MRKSVFFVSLTAILSLSCSTIQASGFNAKHASTKLTGQAYSGSGVSDDPLAAFTNPAATILATTHEASLQSTFVIPHIHFKGSATRLTSNLGLPTPTETVSGKSRQAGEFTAAPSGAVTFKLGERARFNINISSPFDLAFNYKNNFVGRSYSIKSAMETVNINPNIAFRINDKVTFGAGFQAMRTELTLSNGNTLFTDIGFPNVRSKFKGDNWGYGWTLGALFEPVDILKIALSYRSKISTKLKGRLTFSDIPSNADMVNGYTQTLGDNQLATVVAGALSSSITDCKARAKISYPDTFVISSSLAVSPQWTILLDAVRTQWKSVRQIEAYRRSGTQAGNLITAIPQYWHSKWFLSTGVNYKHSDYWTFRAGAAYDKSPTSNRTRVPSIPDANKFWLAAGATYNWNKNSSISMSYGHEFYRKSRINLPGPFGGSTTEPLPYNNKGTLNGRIRAGVDLISLQINHKF